MQERMHNNKHDSKRCHFLSKCSTTERIDIYFSVFDIGVNNRFKLNFLDCRNCHLKDFSVIMGIYEKELNFMATLLLSNVTIMSSFILNGVPVIFKLSDKFNTIFVWNNSNLKHVKEYQIPGNTDSLVLSNCRLMLPKIHQLSYLSSLCRGF